MPVTRDALEVFKTAIDLRAYAASLGYALDKLESWRDSSVVRSKVGDKVWIMTGTTFRVSSFAYPYCHRLVLSKVFMLQSGHALVVF